MGKFKKLSIVLLLAFVLFGTVSYAFAEGTSSDLRNFINDPSYVKILEPDPENQGQYKEVSTEGGKFVVDENKTYKIQVRFKENNTYEFENKSQLTYQMPEGIVIPEAQNGSINIIVTDGKTEYTVTANYTLSTDGILSVTFNQEDPNFKYLESATNAGFRYEFSAKFDKTKTEISFSDNVTKQIIFEDDIPGQTTAIKTGTFNETTGQMDYEITISAIRDCTNVKITDSLIGDAITLDSNSLKISDSSGNDLSTDRYEKTNTDKGFVYTIKQMSDKETIKIKYSANIAFSNADNDSDGVITGGQTENKVIAQPDGGDPKQSQSYNEITYKKAEKSNGTVSGTEQNGNKVVDWTITYNKPAIVSAAGDTLTDTISENSTAFMKYDNNGITIQKYDKNGQKVGEPVNVSVTYNEDMSSWSYKIPEGDGIYSYEITYHTIVDMTAVNNSNTTQILENTFDSDKTKESTGSIGIPPSNSFDVTKTAVSYNEEEIEWCSEISVPESGANTFIVKDALPSIYLNNAWHHDEMVEGSLRIEGLYDNETYSYTIVEGSHNDKDGSDRTHKIVTITFYKNTEKTETGLKQSTDGNRRTIKVYLKTKVDQEWLQAGYQSKDWQQIHTNNIDVNDSFKADYSVTLSKNQIEKKGPAQLTYNDITDYTDWQNPVTTRYYYFVYDVVVSGNITAPLTVTDDFDTSILKVADPISGQPQMVIYGDDNPGGQYQGETPVSYTDTVDGITIIAPTIPTHDDGSYYPYYRIHYYLQLKDGVDLRQYVLTNQGVVANTVKWGAFEDTFEYTGEYDALNKYIEEAEGYYPNAGTRKVKYVIEYNPQKIQLNKGNDITLKDVMDANLTLDYSSVQFTTDPEATISYNITGTSEEDGQENAGGTKAVFTIPDETYVKITYIAKVVGNEYKSFNNTASTERYREEVRRTGTFSSDDDGSGDAAVGHLVITKVDEKDASKKLSGVKFKVYPERTDNPIVMDNKSNNTDAADKGKDYAIITTDENGVLDISGNTYHIYFGQKYFIEELETPPGYKAPTFNYYFTLVEDWADVNYNNPYYTYFRDDSFQIKNTPLEGLVVEKQMDSDDVTELARPFTFRISKLNETGDAVDTSFNEKLDDVQFTNGVGKFVLADDQQKSFTGFETGTKLKVEEIDGTGYTIDAYIVTVTSQDKDDAAATACQNPCTATTSDNYTKMTFTNRPNNPVGSVTLQGTKVVEDADGDTTEERTFNYSLRYKDTTGEPITSGSVTLNDGDTSPITFGQLDYTLESLAQLVSEGKATTEGSGSEQTWVIKYDLTEDSYSTAKDQKELYANTQKIDVTVTVDHRSQSFLNCVVTTDGNSISFKNTERKNISVPVSGTKTLEGREPTETDKWSFTISSTDTPAGPLPSQLTVTNSGRSFSFSGITFTPQDLGENGTAKTYHYKVSESGSVENVSNATADQTFTITLSVDPDTQELKAVTDPADLGSSLNFINHYYAPTNTVLGAKKTMTNGIWPSGTPTFTFRLTGENEKAKEKLKTTNGNDQIYIEADATQNNPTAKFALAFTERDLNKDSSGNYILTTFDFILKEVIPTGAVNNVYKGVTYSTKEVPVKIDVAIVDKNIQTTITANGYTIPLDNNIFTVGDFENTYNTSEVSFPLKVKKSITDTDGQHDQERRFTFELRYKAAAEGSDALYSQVISMRDNEGPKEITFTSITYTREFLDNLVKSGNGYATSGTDSSGNSTWTVYYALTEKPDPATNKGMKVNDQSFDVTVTVTDNGEGGLTISWTPAEADLVFTNTERNDEPLELKGQKILTGRDWNSTDQWTVNIETTDGGPLPNPASITVTQNNRSFSFNSFKFTPQHLGDNSIDKTYHYKVYETGTVNGVHTDEAIKEFSVTVSVDRATGDLKAVSSPADLTSLLTFTNDYHAEGSLVLAAAKSMGTTEWPSGISTFNFVLEGMDEPSKAKISSNSGGQETITASATKDDTIANFPVFTVTETDSSSYKFKLKEQIPTGATNNTLSGVTYDTQEIIIDVIIPHGSTGTIEPEVWVNNSKVPKENNIFNVGTFINSYKPTDCTFQLTASKSITDADGNTDEERSFTFELRYKSAEAGSAAAYTKTITMKESQRPYNFSFDGITFSVDSLNALVTEGKATKATVEGKTTWTIPFILTEKPDTATNKAMKENTQSFEITVTVTDNGLGTLSCSYTSTPSNLVFTNTERNNASVKVSGRKNLTGRAWNATTDKWTYTIEGVKGAGEESFTGPLPKNAAGETVTSVENNTERSFSFEDLVFTPQHLGENSTAKTYHYTVKESGSVTAVTNDTSTKSFSVTVDIDKSTGQLTATPDTSDLTTLLTFKNDYHEKGSVQISAVKTGLTTENWPSGTPKFTFKLEDNAEGQNKLGSLGLTAEVTKDDLTADFAPIQFTEQDMTGETTKTYQFKLTEVVPSEAVNNQYQWKGVTYAKDPITIEVTLTSDGQGNITSAVTANNQTVTASDGVFNVGSFANSYTAAPCDYVLKGTKTVNDGDGQTESRTIKFNLLYTSDRTSETTQEITINDGATQTFAFSSISYNIEKLNDLTSGNKATRGTENGKITWTIPYILTEDTVTGRDIIPNTQSFPITVKVYDDGEGHLVCPASPDPASYTFVNNERNNVTVSVKGSKMLTGASVSLYNEKWTYTISSEDQGAPMPTDTQVKNTNGAFSFPDITFTPDHLGDNAADNYAKIYTYKVTESGDVDDVRNDPDSEKTFTVTVSVDPSNGKLKAVPEPMNLETLLNFTNNYYEQGAVIFDVTKIMTDWPAGAEFFEFKLEGADGDEVAKQKVGTNGMTARATNESKTAQFNPINFTLADLGSDNSKTYKFKISEVIPDDTQYQNVNGTPVKNYKNGVSYATEPIEIEVKIEKEEVDDGNGGTTQRIKPTVTVGSETINGKDHHFQVGSFTNSYKPLDCPIQLSAYKSIQNVDGKNEEREFTFELKQGSDSASATSVETVTIQMKDTDANKPINFQTITYSVDSLDSIGTKTSRNGTTTWTIPYIITETATSYKDMKKNERVMNLTVTVTDDGTGQLKCSSSPTATTMLFVNEERNDAKLTVGGKKELSGREWKNTDVWSFTISGVPADGETEFSGPLPAPAVATLDANHTFQFADLVFTPDHLGDGLSAKTYSYKVSENGTVSGVTNDNEKTFSVTVSLENDELKLSTIPDDLTTLLTFKNEYHEAGNVTLAVTKSINQWPDGVDSFQFKLSGNDVASQGKLGAEGEISAKATKDTPQGFFAPIAFTGEDAGKEYSFTVSEVIPEDAEEKTAAGQSIRVLNNVIYSAETHTVTIKMNSNGLGGMIPVVSVDGEAIDAAEDNVFSVGTFTNTYVESGNDSVTLQVTKSFEGTWPAGQTFSFTLTPVNGGPMPENGTVTATADSRSAFFGTIRFTAEDMKDEEGNPLTEKVFTYEIREVLPEGVDSDGIFDGIRYDTAVHTVSITVQTDAIGNIRVVSPETGIVTETFTNREETQVTPTPSTPTFHRLPETGFSALRPTALTEQPKDLVYRPLAWTLEIPSLALITDIVEVPSAGGEYPVTWLGYDAGLLEGYALPGQGPSILTGHNHLNTMEAGPFVLLREMGIGDRIFVLDPNNEMQTFAVYANEKIAETDIRGLERIAGQFKDSLTLITCEDERAEGGYANRRIIAARPITR